jgi:hypothetical protein
MARRASPIVQNPSAAEPQPARPKETTGSFDHGACSCYVTAVMAQTSANDGQ